MGAALALGLVLLRDGVRVTIGFSAADTLPESLSGLPGCELVVSAGQVGRDADLVVTVDVPSLNRLGELAELAAGPNVLVIDHHRSNTGFGTANFVDPLADSTTMLIAELLDAWGKDIDTDVARCLYAGLSIDTGSFRWATAAGFAVGGPAGRPRGRQRLAESPTARHASVRLAAPVVAGVGHRPAAAGRGRGSGLVYAVVTHQDWVGNRSEELESIVDIVRTTHEAGVAAVFKEIEPQRWSVSMRSKAVDVSAVAAGFGGGGHTPQPAIRAVGPVQHVVAELTAALG